MSANKKKQTGQTIALIVLIIMVLALIAAIILAAKGILVIKDKPAKESESISESEPEPKPEPVKSINIVQDTLELTWGTPVTPEIKVEGEGTLVYTVSDSSYADVDINGAITGKRTGSAIVTASFAEYPEISDTVTVNISPLIAEEEGVTYVNGILIANKTYGLPDDFGDWNDEADAAFDRWADAAANEGLSIYVSSGYRSYGTQYSIYWREYDEYGFDYVEGSTARPGFSEHQTGLAFDLNSISMSFEDTAEFEWCMQHAHEYGFILRYPEGKTDITGYMYEPWHFRYIGDEATSVYESGLTLEEYLGIDSAYTTNEVYR